MADEPEKKENETNPDASQGEKGEPKLESSPLFNSMRAVIPPRDVMLPEEGADGGGDEHAPIEERMEGSRKLTDVQVVIKQLFPDSGIVWFNALQMARVLPEYYVSLKRIFVKHLVRSRGLSVPEAIAMVEVAVGIPMDGEGRIEAIAVMGKAAETEETKEKNRMGLP